MTTAVQLDGEPRLGAVEVEDVLTNEILPPESPAAQTAVTEEEPRLGLRVGGSTPHLTGVPNEFWTVLSQSVTTLTPAPCIFSVGPQWRPCGAAARLPLGPETVGEPGR